jgi:hypothetical protein
MSSCEDANFLTLEVLIGRKKAVVNFYCGTQYMKPVLLFLGLQSLGKLLRISEKINSTLLLLLKLQKTAINLTSEENWNL